MVPIQKAILVEATEYWRSREKQRAERKGKQRV